MQKAIMISHALICVSFGPKQMKRSTQLPTGCVQRDRPKAERTVKNFWVGIGKTSKKVLSLRQSCPNGSQLIACCTTACISSSTTDKFVSYWANGMQFLCSIRRSPCAICKRMHRFGPRFGAVLLRAAQNPLSTSTQSCGVLMVTSVVTRMLLLLCWPLWLPFVKKS